MHRSMKESELTHKTTEHAKESKDRGKSAGHEQAASQIHAHERATVPQEHDHTGRAVRKSVGHYIEHTAKPSKGLRKERY